MSSNLFISCLWSNEQEYTKRKNQYEQEIIELNKMLVQCKTHHQTERKNQQCHLIQSELDHRKFGLEFQKKQFQECQQIQSMLSDMKMATKS